MSGFPSRLLRSIFGPKVLVNTNPVENPNSDLGAEAFMPLFHQVAGMNLLAPRAVLLGFYTGAVLTIQHQAEAWSPDNDQVHPTPARSAAGVYTYTFASTYKDENGADIATVLLAARVSCHRDLSGGFANRISAHAWKDATNPLQINVRLWDTAGTGVDHPFWLEVF
jgi:hypothetical protein